MRKEKIDCNNKEKRHVKKPTAMENGVAMPGATSSLGSAGGHPNGAIAQISRALFHHEDLSPSIERYLAPELSIL